MPLTLPTTFIEERRKLRQPHGGFVFGYEIPFPEFGEALRVVLDTRSVTWNGNKYYPYDFHFDAIRATTDDETTPLNVKTKHADFQLRDRFDDRRGFTGRKCIIRVLHRNRLGETDVPTYRYRITKAQQSSGAGIGWVLGDLLLWTRLIPHRIFSKRHCGFPYGGRLCGYPIHLPWALTSCSHLNEGPNGCEEHGISERNNGELVLHPQRIGAFLSAR